MISQTETSGGAGQYGFYAVPKALQPKKKYRDIDNEYEDQQEVEDDNTFAVIDDREATNQKQLERDYYVDQAPYPEFKPKQRGLDFGVQIERGDLFDFDLEVRPLIQIIVGRSVVSAMNELQEEKERDERRQNLDKYQKKRNAELMVTQRLQAKHKRKQQQSSRRKLQKDLYVKNQKQLGKKIIAMRNTKQSLLGLKEEILNELQDAGYLRSEATSDLKIKYEDWLYEQIMEALRFKQQSQRTVERMIVQEQKKIASEHQKAINEEMSRRKAIQDERQRIERQQKERKEKKRYRKWRQKLSSQRQSDFIKFEQLLEHYQQCNNILKYGDLSNGFSNNSASRQTVYIAGGLDNYLLALLQSSGKDFTVRQLQELLIKIINESGRDFEISLRQSHYNKIQEVKKKMYENKKEFMAEKDGEVKDLAQQISLDLSTLEAAKTSIKSNLHNRFIEAFLSIYLTTQPDKTQQNDVELNQNDRKRLQYANRIVLISQSNDFVQRLENINEVLRVRFEILQSPQNSETEEKKEEEKNEQQEQFIDIYDGEGWERYAKTAKKQLNKIQQSASAYTLNSFQNSFVFDERVMHYLQLELEKITDLKSGDKLKQYIENICNIRGQIKKDIPVYDGEIKWEK